MLDGRPTDSETVPSDVAILNDLPPMEDRGRKMSFDVIMDQINRVEKSKLRLCLKVIYSAVIGLIVSSLSQGKIKWNKSLGVLASILTFYLSKLIRSNSQAGPKTKEEA